MPPNKNFQIPFSAGRNNQGISHELKVTISQIYSAYVTLGRVSKNLGVNSQEICRTAFRNYDSDVSILLEAELQSGLTEAVDAGIIKVVRKPDIETGKIVPHYLFTKDGMAHLPYHDSSPRRMPNPARIAKRRHFTCVAVGTRAPKKQF